MLQDEPFTLVDNGSTFTPHDVRSDPRQLDLIERRE